MYVLYTKIYEKISSGGLEVSLSIEKFSNPSNLIFVKGDQKNRNKGDGSHEHPWHNKKTCSDSNTLCGRSKQQPHRGNPSASTTCFKSYIFMKAQLQLLK